MRLDLSRKPRKIDLGLGVIVTVKPSPTDVIVAAGQDMASTEERGRVPFARAVARQAIIAWEGLEGEDGGILDPTPEAIDAMMALWPLFAAFEAKYVTPALVVVTEGNA
jgi:hypothetical protein